MARGGRVSLYSEGYGCSLCSGVPRQLKRWNCDSVAHPSVCCHEVNSGDIHIMLPGIRGGGLPGRVGVDRAINIGYELMPFRNQHIIPNLRKRLPWRRARYEEWSGIEGSNRVPNSYITRRSTRNKVRNHSIGKNGIDGVWNSTYRKMQSAMIIIHSGSWY